jgi:hypothetical protein
MKSDFHITITKLLQNAKEFVSVELQNWQRHTNEIVVKFQVHLQKRLRYEDHVKMEPKKSGIKEWTSFIWVLSG